MCVCARARECVHMCARMRTLSCSVVSDSFVTLWTIGHQAPLSMGFLSPEYWSWLSFPSPGTLPDPGIEPVTPALLRRQETWV